MIRVKKARRIAALLGLTLAVASLARTAQAADLPVKVPSVLPTAAADPGWTGFYIGLHAGYGWGQNGGTSFTDSPPGSLAASFAAGLLPRFIGADPQGALGGEQFGYNLQITPQWVLGLQADFSSTSIKGSGTYNFATVPGVAFGSTTHAAQSLDWLATVRGRAGYTFDHILLFGTGGVAFGAVKTDVEVNVPALPSTAANPGMTTTRTGWAAGAGAEYALASHWTTSIEWLHYDLGHSTISAQQITAGVPTPIFLDGTSVTRGNVLSAALNYRL
jgi:outer membrane immunogenic protein